MFKFFTKNTDVSAGTLSKSYLPSTQPLSTRGNAPMGASATTPTIPPGGNLDRNTLKAAMKYREDNGLGGNFWDGVTNLAKKAKNIGKELDKAGKVVKAINTGLNSATVVVKPATASYEGNTTGIPLGSGIPEPQVANMTATDTPKDNPVKSYLLPVALGAAAVGLFLAVTRKK